LKNVAILVARCDLVRSKDFKVYMLSNVLARWKKKARLEQTNGEGSAAAV